MLRKLSILTVVALLSFSLASLAKESEVPEPSNDATLSSLSLWSATTLDELIKASFGEDEGGFLEGFVKALLPQLKSKINLNRKFRKKVESYSATVGYGVTSLYVVASGSHSEISFEVTGTKPDDVTPLQTGTRWDGLDLKLEDRKIKADFVRTLKDIPVGRSAIKINVTAQDGKTFKIYTVAVVRQKPDTGNAEERDLYFFESFRNRDWDGVKITIKAGADANKTFRFGRQTIAAISAASAEGNEEVISMLIAAGADVNTTKVMKKRGGVVFRMAGAANTGTVEGAEDMPDGSSPLILASHMGHNKIVSMLIAAGADVNYETPDGTTALDVAKNSRIVKLLQEAGAKKEASTKNSESSAGKVADGVYRVKGSNPTGSTYKGTVKITHKEGSKYTFAWKIGPSSYAGTGELKDNVMTVKWGTDSPAIYKVEPDGTLNGTWAKGKGTEILTPTR